MSNNLQINGGEASTLLYSKLFWQTSFWKMFLNLKRPDIACLEKRSFKIGKEKNRRETFDALSLKTYGEI